MQNYNIGKRGAKISKNCAECQKNREKFPAFREDFSLNKRIDLIQFSKFYYAVRAGKATRAQHLL